MLIRALLLAHIARRRRLAACVLPVSIAAATLALAAPLAAQVVPGMPAENSSADLARFRAGVNADMDSLLLRYERAWSRRDAGALAALFALDAGLAPEGRPPLHGRDSIARVFGGVLRRMRWGHFSSRVVDVSDDAAYVLGTAELEWETASGERYRLTTPFALTARRAFPEPWLITWQRFDANITLPPQVLALAPGARAVRRAEGELWAGDSLPGIARVSAETAEFIAYTVRGGRRDFDFFLRRTVERVAERGSDVLRVIHQVDGRAGGSDTTVVSALTLAPLRWVSSRQGHRESVAFEGLRLRGLVRMGGAEPKPLDLSLTEPVYDAGALPELLRALPLATESYAKFRLFDPEKGVQQVTVSIVGSEELKLADGGTLATWLVWVTAGETRRTVWVSKETQQLVQLVTPLGDGAERWVVRIYPSEQPN